jgi:ABC-type polysaccharide/polyol phosphate export permease
MLVFFRDTGYLYGVFLTLLSVMTPIFYPVSILPDGVRTAVSFNPMLHFVTYFRNVAVYGKLPTIWDNAVCIGFAVSALFVGVYAFMSKQDKFILYI